MLKNYGSNTVMCFKDWNRKVVQTYLYLLVHVWYHQNLEMSINRVIVA